VKGAIYVGFMKCPECGGTMEKLYNKRYEYYFECIQCGYGELVEMDTYDEFDSSLYDDFEEYEYDDIELYEDTEDEF